MQQQSSGVKITKLNGLVEALCGIYTRVARRLGVHRTFVSRVWHEVKDVQNLSRMLWLPGPPVLGVTLRVMTP
jgi:hypothetical protein